MGDKMAKKHFMSRGLFAASNSAEGFKNYYDKVFDRKKLERVYIIKGGPGTGKSRFMRDAAEYSEKRGYSVEYYNCSSDPDSLDGIIIDGRIALLDGTAPHAVEPEIPGARDEIINLGEFWDGIKLAQRYSEIVSLCEAKNACYAKGYRYLSGCGELAGINRSLVLPAIKSEKLMNYVTRLVSTFPKGDGFSQIPALVDSVGMKGRVRYDTYEKCAEKLYYVVDWYSTAHVFLSAIITCAQRNDIPLKVSYDPINPERPDCVYFCNSGASFVATEPEDAASAEGVRINMKRFVDKEKIDEVKREFKYNQRFYEALLSSACDSFAEAGEAHFKLENIYVSCMDFSAKERFTASFCEMLGRELSK